MFPLKNTEAYIHANGYRSTLGKELAARDAEISELGSEIQALTNYDANTGVKNVLINTATSQTINGVTFTVNDDGTVKVNGTATADAIFYLNKDTDNLTIRAGNYLVNGSPVQGSWDTIAMVWGNYTINTTEDKAVSLAADYSGRTYIKVANGQTANNLLFKPMIRPATITDPTYQPYTKTNVELTQDVAIVNISDSFYDSLETGISVLDAAVYKQGKHIFGSFVVQSTDAFVESSATAIMTLKYAPIVSINTFFALSNGQWGSAMTLGYMYVNPASKAITLEVRDADKHFAKIMIDYAIA